MRCLPFERCQQTAADSRVKNLFLWSMPFYVSPFRAFGCGSGLRREKRNYDNDVFHTLRRMLRDFFYAIWSHSTDSRTGSLAARPCRLSREEKHERFASCICRRSLPMRVETTDWRRYYARRIVTLSDESRAPSLGDYTLGLGSSNPLALPATIFERGT